MRRLFSLLGAPLRVAPLLVVALLVVACSSAPPVASRPSATSATPTAPPAISGPTTAANTPRATTPHTTTHTTPHITTPHITTPHITTAHIPYSAARKAEMAGYAQRHYGISTSTLTPSLITLHFTESWSMAGVVSTFSANTPNRGELPGTCAHYLVGTDGTILELVAPTTMCRHVIGLNHKAIGIEVSQASEGHGSAWADQQILARPTQMRSLLWLVRTLQARFGIPTSGVIGHGTANSTPGFVDLEGWRNDHTDWGSVAVAEFRRRLGD